MAARTRSWSTSKDDPSAETKRGGMDGVEHGLAWQIELVERVQPQHARAVHWHTDLIVLLDDDDAEPCGRKIARRQKTRGAAADDDDVPTDGHQYLRPLDSHLPRKLIQNDNRIKRISSQNDCCRT